MRTRAYVVGKTGRCDVDHLICWGQRSSWKLRLLPPLGSRPLQPCPSHRRCCVAAAGGALRGWSHNLLSAAPGGDGVQVLPHICVVSQLQEGRAMRNCNRLVRDRGLPARSASGTAPARVMRGCGPCCPTPSPACTQPLRASSSGVGAGQGGPQDVTPTTVAAPAASRSSLRAGEGQRVVAWCVKGGTLRHGATKWQAQAERWWAGEALPRAPPPPPPPPPPPVAPHRCRPSTCCRLSRQPVSCLHTHPPQSRWAAPAGAPSGGRPGEAGGGGGGGGGCSRVGRRRGDQLPWRCVSQCHARSRRAPSLPCNVCQHAHLHAVARTDVVSHAPARHLHLGPSRQRRGGGGEGS